MSLVARPCKRLIWLQGLVGLESAVGHNMETRVSNQSSGALLVASADDSSALIFCVLTRLLALLVSKRFFGQLALVCNRPLFAYQSIGFAVRMESKRSQVVSCVAENRSIGTATGLAVFGDTSGTALDI